MPGQSKKISELDSASSLSNSDLLEVAVVNALSETGYSSKKTTIGDVAALNPQAQADWTEADNSEPSYIKNKPTLATVATSGSYTDLSSTPVIPDGLSDLTDDVNISSPVGGQILKYDGTSSKWVNSNDRSEPQPQSVTLLAASWAATTSPMPAGYTITVAVTGVTAISNQEILPLEVTGSSDITNNDALMAAEISDAGQSAGYITLFAKNLPSTDLSIRVIVRT